MLKSVLPQLRLVPQDNVDHVPVIISLSPVFVMSDKVWTEAGCPLEKPGAYEDENRREVQTGLGLAVLIASLFRGLRLFGLLGLLGISYVLSVPARTVARVHNAP